MARIKKLSDHEAQKIAAGEVVERPANIVKELVENSLDAQATQITIYIEDGGKQLIRVVDNGQGMSSEDARLCFLHHTTSKITCVDDLHTLQTFGFRGEALSSISAVSKVTLITKEAAQDLGVQLTLEQATIIDECEVSCNQGTDLCVRDIFFNVPARKKFLKTRETEWRQIVTLFSAFCLDYRTISFKLFSEGKLVFNCPAVATLPERIAQLFDAQLSTNSIEISTTHVHSITIEGAITNHHFYKYDRSGLFFFVNNRWIKNHKLASALLKGYLNVLPTGRYPAACIFLSVPLQEVDINVHPRKEEVQFLHPRTIEQLITQTVKTSLEKQLSSQLRKPVLLADSNFAFTPVHAFFEQMQTPMHVSQNYTTPSIALPTFDSIETHLTMPEQQRAFALPIAPADALIREQQPYTIIGQFHQTYILIEKEDGLFLIDQHAAHERILYEQFSQARNSQSSIKLLFPEFIQLAAEDFEKLVPHLHILHANGFEVEQCGPHELVVQAAPVQLKHCTISDLIKDIIGWITNCAALSKDEFYTQVHEKMHAQMACKAAVKAGDVLTIQHMHQLLADLDATDNRFSCPHGRPTGWLLPLIEIEKKFKRNYK